MSKTKFKSVFGIVFCLQKSVYAVCGMRGGATDVRQLCHRRSGLFGKWSGRPGDEEMAANYDTLAQGIRDIRFVLDNVWKD